MSWSPFAAASPKGWSPFADRLEAYVFTPGADQPYESNTRALVEQEWAKAWPMLYSDVLGLELSKSLLTALALAWYRADKGTHAFLSETAVPVAYIAKARQFVEWLLKARESSAAARDLARGLMRTAWDQIPFGAVDWAWVGKVGLLWSAAAWQKIAAEFSSPWPNNPPPLRFATLDPAAPLPPLDASSPTQTWVSIPFESPLWTSAIPFAALPWGRTSLDGQGKPVSLTRNADGSFVTSPDEFVRRARLVRPCPAGQMHDEVSGLCVLPSLPPPPTPIVEEPPAAEACPPPNAIYPATGECLSPTEIEVKKREEECLAKGWLWDEEMYTCGEPEKPPPEQPPPGVEHVNPSKRCRSPNVWDGDLRTCLTPARQEELKKKAADCAAQGKAFDKRAGSCVSRDTGTSSPTECGTDERFWAPTTECVTVAEYDRRSKLSGACQERGGTFDAKTLACSKPPEPEPPPIPREDTEDENKPEESNSPWPTVFGLGALAIGAVVAVRLLSPPSAAEGPGTAPEPTLD